MITKGGWCKEFNPLFKTCWLEGEDIQLLKQCEVLVCSWWVGRQTEKSFKSMKVNNIDRSIVNEGEPVLYYLKDGSKHRFIREELQIVPPGTKLPPEDSLCHFDFHNSTSENKKKQNMQQNSPYKTTNYNMSQPELHVQKKNDQPSRQFVFTLTKGIWIHLITIYNDNYIHFFFFTFCKGLKVCCRKTSAQLWPTVALSKRKT